MSAIPFPHLYPWAGQRYPTPAGDLHYLDEGPRRAPVMLALHGNPTWSFYYRTLITAFSGRFRVVVPDHLGCGLSDKPQHWPYRLEGHVQNLTALVESLDLRDITLVVHDWGGAIGMGLATRQPDRLSRFVVLNTAAFLSPAIPASIAAVKLPGFGALTVRGFNAFAGLATHMAVSNRLSPEVARALTWPYGSWHDRIATLRFVQDIPMHRGHPSYGTLNAIDRSLPLLRGKPMLICWGDDDFCFTPVFRRQWVERFPEAQVHAWTGVGHYVMEDAPGKVVEAIEAWIPE